MTSVAFIYEQALSIGFVAGGTLIGGISDHRFELYSQLASLVFRLLCLAPLLFAVWITYPGLRTRLTMALACFPVVVLWLASQRRFGAVGPDFYDFAAVGFLFGLYALLLRAERLRFWHVAALAVGGQLCFEHLGMVCGVAVFVHHLALAPKGQRRKRLPRELGSLAMLGALCLAVAWVLVVTIEAHAGPVFFDTPGSGPAELYRNYGSHNLAHFVWLLSDVLLMVAVGATIGLVAHLGLGRGAARPGSSSSASGRHVLAAGAVAIGFCSAAVVGVFTSGLYIELGRQLLPLSCLLVLLTERLLALRASAPVGSPDPG